MYRKILEEFFGEDEVLKEFDEEEIDTLDFRVAGQKGFKFILPAQFTNQDTVGYGRAMLKTVIEYVEQISKEVGKASINLSRASGPESTSATAIVLIETETDLMQQNIHHGVYTAAKAIRNYGDRIRSSF